MSTRRSAPADSDSRRGLRAGTSHPAPIVAAWAAALLLCVIATFHAAVFLGAPWGEYTQGGYTSGTLTTSGRIVAAISCMLSIAMAASILSRVGRGPLRQLPGRAISVLSWFTTVYAGIAVILNLMTRSTSERAVWAPVSVVLLALVVYVMVRTTRERPVRVH